MKKAKLLILLISVLIMSGCGSKGPDSVVFQRENLDMNYVEKIAILPFDNLTSDDYAGDRIRNIVFTEAIASGKFEVVEQGLVDAAQREMALGKDTAIDAPVLKILGKRLGVNAFLTGSVNSLKGGGGAYNYPEVSITMNLVGVETAEVLWRSTSYKNGYSLWNRLFDLNPQDEFEITLLLVEEMLSTILK